MNSDQRKGRSLLLRLAAMIFGFVTLAEVGAAVHFIAQTHVLQFLAQEAGIGFGVVEKPETLDFLLLVLLVLSSVLTVVTLVLLNRRKKKNAKKDGR